MALQIVLASGAGEFAMTVPESRPRKMKANIASDPVSMEVRQAAKLLRHRLDRHAMARTVFAKLAIVERELVRHGYSALRSLPVELLHEALEQLICIMGQRHGELEVLRMKIVEVILARGSPNRDFGNHLSLSVFDAPHKLEVVEGGESEFFLALAQQELAPLGATSAAINRTGTKRAQFPKAAR